MKPSKYPATCTVITMGHITLAQESCRMPNKCVGYFILPSFIGWLLAKVHLTRWAVRHAMWHLGLEASLKRPC